MKPQPAQAFFSASTNPATPFRNPSFTTPRKPFDPDLFSEASGAESSPADNGDTEDTPDLKLTRPMAAFSVSKPDKKPIFGRYGLSAISHSPGRDLRRSKHDVVQKVRKRRRTERDPLIQHTRRSSISSDTDSDTKPRKSHAPGAAPGWFSGLLSTIEKHPDLPQVLSHYAQTTLNVFFALLLIYVAFGVVRTIQADISKAEVRAVTAASHEIQACINDYAANRCALDVRVPAMETSCREWELCIARDAAAVGRAEVSAHTFARLVNEFFEEIGWKAIVVIVGTGLVMVAASNVGFAMMRKNFMQHPGAYYGNAQHHQQPQTPWPSHAPQQDWGWGAVGGGAPQETPSRRLAAEGYEEQGIRSIMPKTPHGSPRKGSRH